MKKPSLLNRLREKKAKRKIDVGITWYDQDSWVRVKSSAIDAERFEKSYIEWLKMAMIWVSELRNEGMNAIPYHIEADEFFAWCAANNKQNDAPARAQLVGEMLRKKVE